MPEIMTSRGLPIFYDDEDHELISQFSWYANVTADGRIYAHTRVNPRVRMSMHRMIMEPPPHLVVHHKDNNGLNNRRSNLEIVTQSYNLRAVRFDRIVGVHLHKRSGKWRAQLRIDGKPTSFGMHDTREEAEAAIMAARLERDKAYFMDSAQ